MVRVPFDEASGRLVLDATGSLLFVCDYLNSEVRSVRMK